MFCHRVSCQGVHIDVMSALAARAGATLPLTCQATGTQKGKPLTVGGPTGVVPQPRKNTEEAPPFEVNTLARKTRLKAKGAVISLTGPAAVETMFDLQLQNFKSLYQIAGTVLPSTPLYKLNGKLIYKGWV